jgi:hypothetical protein
MSKKMVQHLVDENNIDLDPSDISYIQALIEGKSKSFVCKATIGVSFSWSNFLDPLKAT